jgi:hypothetical protein
LAVALAVLTGCRTAAVPRDYTPTVARFFLESAEGAEAATVVLPQSGVRVPVNAKPVVTEGDIVNVELVQVDLGQCLLFQLAPSAVRDFYRLTGSHQGRRLVLTLDDRPVGARRIDGAVEDGALFVFVEIPDAQLPALVLNLKKSSAALQRELARKG